MTDDEISRFGVELAGEVWRLSRRKYGAMQLPPLMVQGEGRFDDPLLRSQSHSENYGVLYLGVTAEASFIETLAGVRTHLAVQADVLSQSIVEVEERDGFITESESTNNIVSREWREDWQLTNAKLVTNAPVFDLGNPEAVQFIREQLAVTILALGVTDLDFSHILSDNRELTRAISRWIWSMKSESGKPLFSGIRYRSRFDPDSICLALYDGRFSVDGDIDIQPITSQTPGFAEAASILRLHIA